MDESWHIWLREFHIVCMQNSFKLIWLCFIDISFDETSNPRRTRSWLWHNFQIVNVLTVTNLRNKMDLAAHFWLNGRNFRFSSRAESVRLQCPGTPCRFPHHRANSCTIVWHRRHWPKRRKLLCTVAVGNNSLLGMCTGTRGDFCSSIERPRPLRHIMFRTMADWGWLTPLPIRRGNQGPLDSVAGAACRREAITIAVGVRLPLNRRWSCWGMDWLMIRWQLPPYSDYTPLDFRTGTATNETRSLGWLIDHVCLRHLFY